MAADSIFTDEPVRVRRHGRSEDVVFSVSPVLIHFPTLLLSAQRTEEPSHA